MSGLFHAKAKNNFSCDCGNPKQVLKLALTSARTAWQVSLLCYGKVSNMVSVHPSGQMSSLFSFSLWPQTLSEKRGFLPPPLSQCHGHARGINVDANEVKMASNELNSALPLSCGTHIRSNPFMLWLSWCHNKSVRPIFQHRNLPLNTLLYNRLHLIRLYVLKCHNNTGATWSCGIYHVTHSPQRPQCQWLPFQHAL